MDLRQLAYVEAIARTLNFTRAARELHVAQPALSKAIANLEEELGVQLFERTSRRVHITDAGETFVSRARRILTDAESLDAEMKNFGQGIAGKVRISTWYHVEPMLPVLLRDFVAQNPRIELSIVELPSVDALDALRRDELDLAVMVVNPNWDVRDIAYDIVRNERLVVAALNDDPIAGLLSVGVAELGDRSFIAPRSDTTARVWFDRIFAPLEQPPRIVIETNEIAATIAYVSVGLGLAVTLESLCPPVTPPIVAIPLEGVPSAQVALAWHRTGYRTPAAERALSFARHVAHSAPPTP
jgi:LysR family transcriptional regulator, transcription activator of glutamate synthase operon